MFSFKKNNFHADFAKPIHLGTSSSVLLIAHCFSGPAAFSLTEDFTGSSPRA